jgi:hypothetical protein
VTFPLRLSSFVCRAAVLSAQCVGEWWQCYSKWVAGRVKGRLVGAVVIDPNILYVIPAPRRARIR